MYCGEVLKPHYCSSIEWLRPGNRLGVKRCADSSLHFYIDGVDQGIGAFNVPKVRRVDGLRNQNLAILVKILPFFGKSKMLCIRPCLTALNRLTNR